MSETTAGAKYVRHENLQKIQNSVMSASYREAIEESARYNTGIVNERRARQPYLDTLTGVAQSDCFLWMQKTDRMPGQCHGQLYSYPAKRWKKKRRQYLMNENFYSNRNRNRETESANPETESQSVTSDGGQVPVKTDSSIESSDKLFENSKDGWYGDYDDGSDLPDAGELDDPESDYDDYEEYSSRKKKKRKETPKRKRVEYSDAEKPFSCDLCGARYKTRPGLSYHYTHSHQSEGAADGFRRLGDEEDASYTPPRLQNQGQAAASASNGQSGSHHLQPPPPPVSPSQSYSQQQAMTSNLMSGKRASPISQTSQNAAAGSGPVVPNNQAHEGSEFGGNRPKGKGSVASPQNYCDFCLGDSVENKKTKSAESLVSCSDCGRSAHPSCLQFTPNMIESVKKYRWQCIECKSCGLCGTSENDVCILIVVLSTSFLQRLLPFLGPTAVL